MQEAAPVIFHINIHNKRNIYHLPINDISGLIGTLSSSPQNSKIEEKDLDRNLIESFKQVILKNTCDILILDLCDSRFTPNKLEQILGFLNTSLLKIEDHNILKGICLIVEKIKKTNGIIFFNDLKDYCEGKNIALIITDDSTGQSSFSVYGKFSNSILLPDIKLTTQESTAKDLKTILEQNLQILFGHFLIDEKYHIPAIISLRKILDNTDFINQFTNLCENKIPPKDFYILPIGLPFFNSESKQDKYGIQQLAIYLAKSNNDRIIFDLRKKDCSNKTVLILCDVLSSHNNINQTINELKSRKAKKIILIGLTRFADFVNPESIDTTSILNLDFSAIENETECKFCQQHVKKIEGTSFNELAEQILDIDPFTFWEFIKLNPAFHKAGHEIMGNTTGYHYNFRILAKPIFETYGFYIAYCFINKIKNSGIFLNWIDTIVCPNEKSDPIARTLANHIQELIQQYRQGCDKVQIVEMPRNIFQTVTTTEPGPLVTNYFNSELEYGTKVLDNKSIIIIDQAAHRLNTLSALKNICLSFPNCKILATCLFINRTNPHNFIEDERWGHFISLYNWPNQPSDSKNCFCFNG